MARKPIARSKRYRRKPMRYRKRTTTVSKVYNYVQKTYKTSAFQASNAGQFLAAFSFNLAGVGPNVQPFTALFDQYKIRKIIFKIIPKFSQANTAQNNIVNLSTALDFDDSNSPGSTAAVYEYQTCKMTRGNKIHTRTFRPYVNAIMDGGTAAGNSPRMSPWLDCANTLVPHRGVKLAVEALPLASELLDYDIETIMYLSFKNVR